ncbi:hypothetical protein BCR44DRAFT_1412010 [Catenaria anguillulae PL171]|uniref:NAD-dependent epimerase/dehydratase domain-containing protein n=1 Tax=Catenaria anguillulae PL171 TaxID=765915 RepID=A0A1Y2HYB2_9FUNG|nr:hypothetical protein BCR44DRAFT_1412010 [Catenaria anguillulae PL171]
MSTARVFKRSYSDIVRLSNAKKGAVTIKYGPGGRSSSSGLTVTVFGCTGFLGRYVVNRLGQVGSSIITPWRGDEDSKRHLKIMGDLGQITSLKFDIYNQDQLAECVRHSDIVINLIGRDYATKSFTLNNANVDSARNIAHVCREEGVGALVQLSHLSASESSPSEYLRAKWLAEQAVREEYPQATVVRSATMFGHEDRFLHQIGWMANFPALPVPNDGKTVRRPVYVGDVAQAVSNIAVSADAQGKTFELFGFPQGVHVRRIVDLWIELTRKPISKAYVPKFAMSAYSKFVDAVSPYPKIHPDGVTRLHLDEHPVGNLQTFADAGVLKPKILEYEMLEYVRRYRKADVYHLPGRIPTDN